MDIIFVVDASVSIGKKSFEDVQAFLINVVNKMSFPDTRVGLLHFAGDEDIDYFRQFLMNLNGNKATITAKINQDVCCKYGTAIAEVGQHTLPFIHLGRNDSYMSVPFETITIRSYAYNVYDESDKNKLKKLIG